MSDNNRHLQNAQKLLWPNRFLPPFQKIRQSHHEVQLLEADATENEIVKNAESAREYCHNRSIESSGL